MACRSSCSVGNCCQRFFHRDTLFFPGESMRVLYLFSHQTKEGFRPMVQGIAKQLTVASFNGAYAVQCNIKVT